MNDLNKQQANPKKEIPVLLRPRKNQSWTNNKKEKLPQLLKKTVTVA